MKFTIVKGKDWPDGFSGPVELEDSAYHTHTGKEVGIHLSYDSKEAAELDCQEMNDYNPCGYYFVTDVQ